MQDQPASCGNKRLDLGVKATRRRRPHADVKFTLAVSGTRSRRADGAGAHCAHVEPPADGLEPECALDSWLVAFSLAEPASTSAENASAAHQPEAHQPN